MIRAELLYEQLRHRRDLDPIQVRLVYMVHARKMRMRMLEVRIAAVSGMNEGNQKLLEGLVDDYVEMMFPGLDTKNVDSFEEQAKRLMADELKNVYQVRRITDAADQDAEVAKIMASGSPAAAVVAKHQRDKALEDRSAPTRVQKRRE